MSFLVNLLGDLGVNNSFFVQLLLLFVSYLFLSNFVFKPIGRILKRRKYCLVGREKITEDILKKIKKEHDEYDKKWSEKEKEIFNYREKFLLEIKQKTRLSLEEEVKKQRTKLLNKRKLLKEKKNLLLTELNKKTEVFSDDLIKKVERL